MALKPSEIASAGHPSMTPQSKPLPGREKEMVDNSSGGYSFKQSDKDILYRWMIIGSENGTYYTQDKIEVTKIGTAALKLVDKKKIVEMAKDVIENGKANKLEYAIYSLAYVAYHGDINEKQLVYSIAPQILGNMPKMTMFLACYQAIKKIETGKSTIGGSGICRVISKWYMTMPTGLMAYQVAKYPQRNGFSHADLLRISHIGRLESNKAKYTLPDDKVAIVEYIKWYTNGGEEKPRIFESTNKDHKPIVGKHKIEQASTLDEALKIMKEYNLTHEMVPTKFQGSKEFYDVMMTQSPVHATVWRLGAATAKDCITPMGDTTKAIVQRITNKDEIEKQMIHPMKFYNALTTYKNGRGEKGSLSWAPNQMILEALEDGFYHAIGTVPDSARNVLIAVDHSGSMQGPPLDFACAIASVLLRSQRSVQLVGYAMRISNPQVHRKMSMLGITYAIKKVSIGEGTDSTQPILYAMNKCPDADAIICITDGFTWAGSTHVSQALKKWRVKKPHGRYVEMITSMGGSQNIDPLDMNSLVTFGQDAEAAILAINFITNGL